MNRDYGGKKFRLPDLDHDFANKFGIVFGTFLH